MDRHEGVKLVVIKWKRVHQPLIRCGDWIFLILFCIWDVSFTETLKNIFREKRGLNCPTRMFLINRVQIQTSKSRNIKGNVYCCIFLSCFSALLREKTFWHFKMSKLKYPQHSSYCARQILKRTMAKSFCFTKQKALAFQTSPYADYKSSQQKAYWGSCWL